MRKTLALALTGTMIAAMPLAAQHEDHVDRSREGPPSAPMERARPDAPPELDQSPHVYDGRWFGHASPNDSRFLLDRPFAHGVFGQAGPANHFSVARIDLAAHRLWLPAGFGFEIASWEWPFAIDWCWTCGENFIVYDDPDHAGWYLLYYIPTGQYVHVQYLGM